MDKILEIIKTAKEKRLESLDLSDLALKELPVEIGGLTQLKELILGGKNLDEEKGNQLSCLPAEIGNLTNLEILKIKFNQLEKLPTELANLKNLKRLDLYSNKLTSFPVVLTKLPSLTELDLSSNQIETIPEEISNLINLNKLGLNANSLADVPAGLAELDNLEELYLSSNQLSKISGSICVLTNLKKLYLSSNQIGFFPAEISSLINLEELYFSSNQLTRVHPEIASLKKLKILYLSSNDLKEIPEELCLLRNIRQLYLNDNQLFRLPKKFIFLENLEELYLSDNALTKIPKDFVNFKNLKYLDLEENEISYPPMEIVSQGFEIIKEHICSDNKSGTFLSETSLVYINDEVEAEEKLKVLFGDSLSKEFEGYYKIENNTANDFSLTIDSYSCQQILSPLMPLFIPERAVCLLDLADIEMSCQLAKAVLELRDQAQVILLNSDKEKIKNLIPDYAEKLHFFIPGIGEKNNLLTLLEPCLDKPVFWHESWLAVRRELEKLEDHKLNFKAYLKLCAVNNLDDLEAELVLKFLGINGRCFRLNDDLLVKNYLLLKMPEFRQTLRKLLDELALSKGVFSEEQLSGLIEKKLPQGIESGLLIELCKDSGLAFADEYKNYIFLLFKSESDLAEFKTDFNESAFIFKFKEIPAVLISTLFSRMGEWIFQNNGDYFCSASSTLIEYEKKLILAGDKADAKIDRKAKAILEFNSETDALNVRLSGTVKFELLNLIRSHVRRIVSKVEKGSFEELVSVDGELISFEKLIKAEAIGKKIWVTSENRVSLAQLLNQFETIETRQEQSQRAEQENKRRELVARNEIGDDEIFVFEPKRNFAQQVIYIYRKTISSIVAIGTILTIASYWSVEKIFKPIKEFFKK